jgi:hypothetical protein
MNKCPDVVGFQEPRDNQRDYLIASLPDYSFLYIHAEGGVTTCSDRSYSNGLQDEQIHCRKGWPLLAEPDTGHAFAALVDCRRSVDQDLRVGRTEREYDGQHCVLLHYPSPLYKTADNAARKLAVALCLTKMQSIARSQMPKSFWSGI